jgi:hypothetical protein
LYYYNNLKDPIVLIKDILDELINGDIEDEVYKFAQEDHSKNKLVIMKDDTLNEQKEDIIDTFRNYNKSSNDNTSNSGAVENINQISPGTPAMSEAEESEDEKETELEKIVKEDEKLLPLIEKIESTLSINEILEHKFGIIDENENNDFHSDNDTDDESNVKPDINTNKDVLVSAN